MITRKRYLSLAEQAVALDTYRHIALRAARRVGRSLQLGVLDHEDARQQALVGLLVAARTFDRTAGITFTVHAWRHILTELRRFFRAHQRHGFTCVGPQPPIVLSIFDSGGVDGLPIEDQLAASEDTAEARCDAIAALAVLEDRERRILSARLLEGRTLSSTAKEVHVTTERVRQIQVSAIQTVRQRLRGLAS